MWTVLLNVFHDGLRWDWCEDVYLVWEVGGSWLPPGREAAGPAAGCAASGHPAWYPFSPAFCRSTSSEPALNGQKKQGWRLRAWARSRWELNMHSWRHFKRLHIKHSCQRRSRVRKTNKQIRSTAAQIMHYMLRRGCNTASDITSNCVWEPLLITRVSISLKFAIKLSATQCEAYSLKMQQTFHINTSTVHPLSNNPSQLLP